MERDDVVRQLKAYRAHLASEMRKTDAALKAFGIAVDEPTAARPSRGLVGVPTGVKRPAAANENGTYDLLRRIGQELPPGASLNAQEAIEALEARGWQTDAQNKMNTVNTAMYRLAGWGEWEKVGRGRYRPRQEDAPTAEPPATDASSGGTDVDRPRVVHPAEQRPLTRIDPMAVLLGAGRGRST